jgi:hypothetical protein
MTDTTRALVDATEDGDPRPIVGDVHLRRGP